jgi:predicted PurR-regulated permease PerM
MITFILGASAAIVVGAIVWLVVNIIKMSKQVKHLEKQKDSLWLEIQSRCDSIERMLGELERELSQRNDETFRYVDSRLDKLYNQIERDYVTKKNKLENTIDYNN